MYSYGDKLIGNLLAGGLVFIFLDTYRELHSVAITVVPEPLEIIYDIRHTSPGALFQIGCPWLQPKGYNIHGFQGFF